MQNHSSVAPATRLGIREFSRQSGYAEATVRRAMRELSIKGQFQGRGKATLLSPSEQERLALHIDEIELQGDGKGKSTVTDSAVPEPSLDTAGTVGKLGVKATKKAAAKAKPERAASAPELQKGVEAATGTKAEEKADSSAIALNPDQPHPVSAAPAVQSAEEDGADDDNAAALAELWEARQASRSLDSPATSGSIPAAPAIAPQTQLSSAQLPHTQSSPPRQPTHSPPFPTQRPWSSVQPHPIAAPPISHSASSPGGPLPSPVAPASQAQTAQAPVSRTAGHPQHQRAGAGPAPVSPTYYDPYFDQHPAIAPATQIQPGNHRQTLAPPSLPESYDLGQFRSDETITTLADPGAIAAQAMGAIHALVQGMDADIQQQRVHLEETQRAAHILRLKAKQLQDKKIEYMIQSSTLGQAQQQSTLELQEALEGIQTLGKSPSGEPTSPSSSPSSPSSSV